MKVLLQTTQADCLLACAAMIMNEYKCNVPVYKLIEKIQLSRSGTNVKQLQQVLGNFGFDVAGYKANLKEFAINCPVIAHVNKNHFIVVEKVASDYIMGIDPSIGKMKYSHSEFNQVYSNVVIKILPKENFKNTKTMTLNNSLYSVIKNRRVINLFVGLLVTSLFTQGVAIIYNYMFQSVSISGNTLNIYLLIIIAIFSLTIGSLLQGHLLKKFNILYEQIYGNNMMSKLLNKNYSFFGIRNNGDLMYRINARGMIKDSVLLKIAPSIISICIILLSQMLVFYQDSFLGVLLFLSVILYLLIYIYISRLTYLESNKYTQKLIALNTFTENLVRTISTIKVLNVKNVFLVDWEKLNEEQAQNYGKIIMINTLQNILATIFNYLIPITICLVSVLTSHESNDLLKQISLLPIIYLVIQNTTILGQAFNSVYMVLPNLNKIEEVLDESFICEKKIIQEEMDELDLIKFENLNFSYTNFLCLENVTLNIKKNIKYAVIGKSGSGKSTLLKLIANLQNNYDGQLIFNSMMKNKLIYMDQDTSIIDGTLIENIKFRQSCTEERFSNICNSIDLTSIVEEQPLKWLTKISKGKNLSRGQEQRICLARALIQDADIYLLDEATSNIDTPDEDIIIKRLLSENGLLANKTVLISTHKLNIIEHVDLVIFISNKKVFMNTHENLLKINSDYSQLFVTK